MKDDLKTSAPELFIVYEDTWLYDHSTVPNVEHQFSVFFDLAHPTPIHSAVRVFRYVDNQGRSLGPDEIHPWLDGRMASSPLPADVLAAVKVLIPTIKSPPAGGRPPCMSAWADATGLLICDEDTWQFDKSVVPRHLHRYSAFFELTEPSEAYTAVRVYRYVDDAGNPTRPDDICPCFDGNEVDDELPPDIIAAVEALIPTIKCPEGMTTATPPSATLPSFCFGLHLETQEIILLQRGDIGYWLYNGGRKGSPEDVRQLNDRLGVTPGQAEAMSTGSVAGWDVPTADPRNYDVNGKYIGIGN